MLLKLGADVRKEHLRKRIDVLALKVRDGVRRVKRGAVWAKNRENLAREVAGAPSDVALAGGKAAAHYRGQQHEGKR